MATRSAAPGAGTSLGAAGTTAENSRRWLILAVICTGYLLVSLSLTVMNVALPSVQHALKFSNADRQWVVTAYALSFGSLLLFCGRLADRIGRKETFLAGLAGFAVASVVGGASTNFTMLVTARACQGAFAALLAPAAVALVATTFTGARERAKAFGIFSAVVASGAGLGLILGGVLTSALGWRWCLYVNLIFAGFSLAGGQLLLGRQPKRLGTRMDVPGVLMASGGMFCLVYGFANAAAHSWHTPSTWGFLAAAVALLTVFALWQTRAAHPLLPPRIILDRNRSGAYIAVLLVGTGIFGVLLFLIYYMQTILGYSAITSGVALLPMFVSIIVVASGGVATLLPRFGPRPLITGGLLIGAAGMAWLTGIGVNSGYASHLLGPLLVVGVGIGLIYAVALTAGTSGVAPQETGIASACLITGEQLGGASGTALLNTIAATATISWLRSHLHGRPAPHLVQLAAIHGYTTAFWWCTGIFVGGAVICGTLLRRGTLTRTVDVPGREEAAARS